MGCKRVIIALVILSAGLLIAQTPRTMNYQGKLTDPAGVAITGDHAIVFRIYDSEIAGTMLWSESHPSVTITNGLFDVLLGESSAMTLPFDNEYWIEIEIDSETLAPREKLSSVAYAHRSVYADTAEYVSGGGASDDDWTRVGNIVHAYNTTDTIGIGTASPSGGKLVVLDNTEGTGIHLEAEPPTADGTVRNSPRLSFTDSYRWMGTPGTHTSSIYTSSPCPGCNRLLNFDNGLTKMNMNSSAVEFLFQGDFQNWPNLDMIFLAPRVTSDYSDGTDVILDMRGQYWNGSSSAVRSAKITHEVEDDGNSRMNFKIQSDATRMSILSSGNVGVGTTSPTNKLEVSGEASYSLTTDMGTDDEDFAHKKYVDDALSNYWGINGNSETSVSSNFIGTTNTTGLAFRTDDVERMRLQSGGQLTIGSTTAGGKLDVHQTSSNDVLRIVNYGNPTSVRVRRTQGTQSSPTPTSGAGTVLGRIYGEGYNGSGFTSAALIEIATDAIGGTSDDMPGRITFSTTPDASGTLEERMRITNNGNVGIGTTSPTRTLDVDGDARITGNLGVEINLGVTGQTSTGTFLMPAGAVDGYVLTTDASGNGTWEAASGGGVGGSGTNGRIARFTPDGTTLGNSTFRDDGTTVGLNAAQTSANMLYIQDDRAISAKQGLYVDSYTSNTGTGDIVGLLSKARVTTSGSHNAAGIIGMVDGNNMNWAVGVMAVNKSGSTTPVVPSVLTALYADGSNNWAWSGWFTGGHVAISRATSTQTGELHFHDLDGTALANYVGFKAPTALSSNYVYTLPASFPASSGQVLSSTTAGVLSWTSAGGSGDYIQNQSATNQSADFRIDGHGYFYGDATSYIDIYASSTDQNIVSTDQMILVSAEGIKLRGPYTQVQTSTAMPYVQFDGATQRVGIGTTSPSYNLHVAGSARVNSLNINGAYSLPTSAGTTSQYLCGDGTWGIPSGGGSGWSLTGNSGTTAGSNFIGTTDAQDLVFKTNNTEDVRITTSGELAIGNFSNPEAMLEIRETIADIYVRTYNDYSWQDGGRLALQRMGGSQTSPAATQAGYGLGALDFRGGYGTSVSGVTSASIKSISPVTWASGSNTRGGDLRFYTINISGSQSIYDNERMRIGSQGGVGVNINPTPSTSTNNDPDAYMHVYGGIGIGPVNNSISLSHGQENSIQIASDTSYGGVNDNHSGYLIYSIMPGGWTTGELRFACATDWGVYNTTTPALRVTQSGIYANGTYYSSDRRIKSDFRNMPYGLKQIMALEPLYYSKHIAKDMTEGKPVLGESSDEIGFIAQDLFNIIPEVVSRPDDDKIELWGIDYAKMVPVLVQAIQEQQSKIEELENKIESYKELEKRIELLENK